MRRPDFEIREVREKDCRNNDATDSMTFIAAAIIFSAAVMTVALLAYKASIWEDCLAGAVIADKATLVSVCKSVIGAPQ